MKNKLYTIILIAFTYLFYSCTAVIPQSETIEKEEELINFCYLEELSIEHKKNGLLMSLGIDGDYDIKNISWVNNDGYQIFTIYKMHLEDSFRTRSIVKSVIDLEIIPMKESVQIGFKSREKYNSFGVFRDGDEVFVALYLDERENGNY